MKILKIEICNLASLSDTSIDFQEEPLESAPLILISGDTGSGKSTILDAICLALYDDAPRLTEVSGNRYADINKELKISSPLNLVRYNANKCFCSILFEANNGRTYSAEWSVSFFLKGKKKGLPNKISRILTDIETGEKTTLKSGKDNILAGKEFIGLDYDQFRRTVLLAQGDFSRFLKGTEKEKSSILEKLIGIEMFTTYGERIKNRFSETKILLEHARLKMEDITVLAPEELEELLTKLKKAKDSALKIEVQLKEMDTIVNWNKLQIINSRQLAEAKEDLKKAEEQIVRLENEQSRAIVKQWDLLEPLRSINDAIDAVKRDINAEQEKLGHLAITRAELQVTFKKIIDEIGQINQKIATASRELNAFSPQDLSLITNAEIVKERISLHKKAADNLRKFKKAEEEARVIFDEKSAELAKKDINEREVFKRHLKQLSDLHSLSLNLEIYNRLNQELSVLTEIFNSTTLKMKESSRRYEKMALSTHNAAKTLRSMLSPGDSCPVCGNVVENTIIDAAFEESLIPLKEELDEATRQHKKAESNINLKRAEFLHIKNLLGDEIPDCKKLDVRLDALQHALGVRPQDVAIAIENVDKEITAILQAQKHELRWSLAKSNLNSGQAALCEAEDRLGEYLRVPPSPLDYDALIKRIDKISERHATLTSDLEKGKKSLESFSAIRIILDETFATTTKLPDAKPQNIIAPVSAEIAALKLCADYKSTLERQQALNEKLNLLHHKKKQLIAILPNDLSRFADNSTLGLDAASIKKMRDSLQMLDTEFHRAKGAWGNAKKLLDIHMAARPDTPLSPEEALLKQSELNKVKSDINREIGALETRWEADRMAKDKFKNTIEEVEKAAEACAQWSQLNELLGGEKFKLFVCSEILSYLIDAANHYFLMFQNRYKMEVVPGSFEIMVFDNELHSSRVFSSLSGGEVFMVSLSLALGLASLNQVRFNCDTLFIDEGFGTLSSDCLDAVMDCLDRLQKYENRRVVIISHVEMLRDRIPIQILIRRHGSKSSLHISSFSA